MENNNKRKALGKGLEQLFSNESLYSNPLDQLDEIVETAKEDDIVMLNIDELRSNPYQPRKVFDEEKLNELAKSIKEYGVFQPIIVKESIKGYEIIAGERRVKASKLAGRTTIPAIVRPFTDQQMMEIALLENLQRENLNAIEEANAYQKLIDSLNLTQDELSRKLGKSRSHITNMLGLLTLPEVVKQMISDDKISMSHARILSKLKDDEEIISLANKIVNENLNVRSLEVISQDEKVEKKHKIVSKNNNTNYNYLENTLSDKLGTKVKIRNKKIEISFVNDRDLDRIIEILQIQE